MQTVETDVMQMVAEVGLLAQIGAVESFIDLLRDPSLASGQTPLESLEEILSRLLATYTNTTDFSVELNFTVPPDPEVAERWHEFGRRWGIEELQ